MSDQMPTHPHPDPPLEGEGMFYTIPTPMCSRTAVSLLFVAFLPLTMPAVAQPYPSKPIRIVVPYPPGGGVDIAGRAIAQQFATAFKVSTIVDNRPGAGGQTRAVNRVPACGM